MRAREDDRGWAAIERESAEGYDANARRGVVGYEALHACVAALLRQALGERARLLIAGAGTGEEIVRLGESNAGWSFVGVDPAAAMLAVAAHRVAAAGLAARVTLHHGFVDELPGGRDFDAATLLLVLHFQPDDGAKAALLREIAARLRPGATLLLADLHGDRASPAFARQLAAWRQYQLARGVEAAAVETGFARVLEHVHFVPEERIAALLHEAGFAMVEPFFRGLLFGGWLAIRA